jgi:hypothetical protein
MRCEVARSWLFRLLDDELTDTEREGLESHLSGCPTCSREWKILSLPRRIGKVMPVLEPPPFFYQRLRENLASASPAMTTWQVLLGLSRQVVPGLAAITLLVLSIFAYMQLRSSNMEFYQAYEEIFMPSDRTERMIIADHDVFTDEVVLRALAGQEPVRTPSPANDVTDKK